MKSDAITGLMWCLIVMLFSYIIGLTLLLQDMWIGATICTIIIATCVYLIIKYTKVLDAELKAENQQFIRIGECPECGHPLDTPYCPECGWEEIERCAELEQAAQESYEDMSREG